MAETSYFSDSNSFAADADAFDFAPEIHAAPRLCRCPLPFPADDPQGQYLLARTRASPFARTIPIRRYAQLRARERDKRPPLLLPPLPQHHSLHFRARSNCRARGAARRPTPWRTAACSIVVR